MASSGYVKLSYNGLKSDRKSYKGLEDIIKDHSKEIIDEAYKRANVKAQELLDDIEYDGVRDIEIIPEQFKYGYRITFQGDSLPYVEYGTGVHGEDYDGKQFNAFGRHREKIRAGYEALKNKESEANIRVRKGQQRDISNEIKATKDYAYDYRKTLNGWFYTAKPGDKLTNGKIPSYRNPYLTSRYTTGNKPNHLINNLEDYVNEIIPEIAKEIQIK